MINPIFTSDELLAATSDGAWLEALLDVEVALADAEAEIGVIPASSAAAIARVAEPSAFNADDLGRAARQSGNPVIPLVDALRDRVGGDAAAHVHFGATSQDIMDTAGVLLARRAGSWIEADLDRAATACAALAGEHRATAMMGRTLLQPAQSVPFGFVAAGWLVGLLDARTEVRRALAALAVQFGGSVGTLSALGREGPAVVTALARRLALAEPVLPWHTARQRTAVLAGALGIAAGTAAKLVGDVALLMQVEVGEAAEPAAPGRGVSSSMAHKRNPILATEALAATERAHALVPIFLRSLTGEHQRPLAVWHAEWSSLSDLLALSGGAVARAREVAEGLTVDPERMAANVAAYAHALAGEPGAADMFIDRAIAAYDRRER